MSELIQIILAHLQSDEGPELYDASGNVIEAPGELLEIAQSIAEAIVAAGWPRQP